MANSRIRSCFITAPAGSNLKVLAEALRRRQIDVVAPYHLSLGSDLPTEIGEVLRDVDLVIGVLTRQRRSDWALFELGQAWALGKRILLFAPPDTAHIPTTLRQFLTVRANLSNREAIDFALDQLLAVPETSSKPTANRREKSPLGLAADRYLQGTNVPTLTGYALEAMVAEALRDAGVDVLVASEQAGRDQRVDLAVWSDGLQPFVGNPFLIEIKSNLSSSRGAADAATQLSKYVASAGALWGLLLYQVGPTELRSLPPNVLALQIESLFERLRKESFDDVIRDLRNRRVHGVGV